MPFPTAAVVLALLAELPLPDATMYGKVQSEEGLPVISGVPRARVRRGQAVVLEAPGAFVESEGEFWYVIPIPLETNIGAPGPSGVGAREGDVVDAVLLDGAPLQPLGTLPTLTAGAVTRVDFTGGNAGLIYARGDCTGDLSLNITDGISVLNYLFLGAATPACLEACDGDGNGTLNITDGVYLLNYLFLGGPAPPTPGPDCNVDPDPSELGCSRGPCTA